MERTSFTHHLLCMLAKCMQCIQGCHFSFSVLRVITVLPGHNFKEEGEKIIFAKLLDLVVPYEELRTLNTLFVLMLFPEFWQSIVFWIFKTSSKTLAWASSSTEIEALKLVSVLWVLTPRHIQRKEKVGTFWMMLVLQQLNM